MGCLRAATQCDCGEQKEQTSDGRAQQQASPLDDRAHQLPMPDSLMGRLVEYVVTHEIGFAREVSDHVVFLHEGRVEEEGPPGDVFGQQRSDRFRQFLSSTL